MSTIFVEESRCPQNHSCPVVGYCPTGAIKQKSRNSAPEIDKENCLDCGRCVNLCGYGAFMYKTDELK
ncbi:MAG: 4Fe-4S binding protein [Bacteroidales bacterium]|nr:4Fe-4S binding protein [Bacteroidales bacterium]